MPALTTSGSPTVNGNSTVTIDSTGSDRVQGPASQIDESQGWFAIRCVNPTVEAGVLHHAFTIGDDGSNLIRFYQGETAQGGGWRLSRNSNGEAVTGGGSGGDVTLVGHWTATQVKISLNGAAFTAASEAATTYSATEFDIGQRLAAHHLGTAIYWCAAGTGTLSDADASTIHGFGNTDPDWGDFPVGGEITFLWTCDDLNYLDTGGPTLDTILPDADITTTGWSTAPLFSKINDDSDATVITATAS